MVVVDEAHHLRDQSSASYQLVNRLQKRFLLLLSATPVQNSLLELYNLLTLLQPGIFKTQKEFRSVYMVPGKPREPANRERLRDLMRGVMVRNTRALAALRMPRRHASTLRATPGSGGSRLLRGTDRAGPRSGAAAPRPTIACRCSICWPPPGRHRPPPPPPSPAIAERHPATRAGPTCWPAPAPSAPARRRPPCCGCWRRTRPRRSWCSSTTAIAWRISPTGSRRQKMPFALFSGDMSGPQKDAAVEAFRDDVPVLLCTESGGEGRNLQFCNTLINFDIPWNPMAIEQRIGRIDRIGQTREVFIFNLVTAGTIEDAVLRILDEKINMFELVVGEVGAILGEIDEQQEFSTLVLDAWLQGTEQARADAFAQTGKPVAGCAAGI